LIDQTPLRVVDLAEAVGLSRTSLTERFQKQLGLPLPTSFVKSASSLQKGNLANPEKW
jgi:transcriptional regulator GlxA family with amidase domain